MNSNNAKFGCAVFSFFISIANIIGHHRKFTLDLIRDNLHYGQSSSLVLLPRVYIRQSARSQQNKFISFCDHVSCCSIYFESDYVEAFASNPYDYSW